MLLFQHITTLGNDVDFNSTMQTVTIINGTNSTTVNIPVIDDDIVEGNEMFNITLSLPSSLNGAGVVLANDSDIVSATGIIIDTTIIINTTSESYCRTDRHISNALSITISIVIQAHNQTFLEGVLNLTWSQK